MEGHGLLGLANGLPEGAGESGTVDGLHRLGLGESEAKAKGLGLLTAGEGEGGEGGGGGGSSHNEDECGEVVARVKHIDAKKMKIFLGMCFCVPMPSGRWPLGASGLGWLR